MHYRVTIRSMQDFFTDIRTARMSWQCPCHLAIIMGRWVSTCPPLSMVRYSQLSELGDRGENENAQTLKRQQRGFEPGFYRLRVWHSTADLQFSIRSLGRLVIDQAFTCILEIVVWEMCRIECLLLLNTWTHSYYIPNPQMYFFRLFPSGVVTADFPSPVVSIFCICHFKVSHVLSHRIHKPPFRTFPFPLSWQLHPQHPSPNIPIIFPP